MTSGLFMVLIVLAVYSMQLKGFEMRPTICSTQIFRS